nr:flocculation protein FLO11 isoform X1 [Ciona intestinalis]|eukprot:XP_002131826.1 flocculation protein FLO11 isoform X1 [Ciona intestinalis]
MDRIENLLDTGGRYLSPADRQFVSTLLSELEQFQYQAPKDRALMFHPLGGFQRYLIHKVTEVFPKLTSFSIGDDSNRRTVVCFKSKKKDQQQGLQANGTSKTLPNPKNEYVNAPVRGREEEGRQSAPRSRDSSRSRKKNEPYDANTSKQPRQPKQLDQAYLPKPLRTKKATNKRDQMKRSRSLQSSPVRMDEEVYHTDDDGRRGRRSKGSESGKRAPRSASLKPSSRRRERDVSPEPSEDEFRRQKQHPPLRHNVSDVSIHKRSQGLRMEGKVVNGDIADPHSYGDSESDIGRVDHVAVNKEKERHKKKAPPVESLKRGQPRSRRHSQESSARSVSEDSDAHHYHRDPRRTTPGKAKRRPEYSDVDSIEVESRISGIHDDMDEDSSNDYYEDEDSASMASDERPPSYERVKHSSSIKKAERNLNRIKRVDSQRSKPTSDEDVQIRDSSSSSSGRTVPRGSTHKSPPASTSSHHSKEGKMQRSSTMPRSTKEPAKKQRSSSKGRSQTLKGPPVSTGRSKSQSTKKHPAPPPPQKEEEKPKRSSSSKQRKKPTSLDEPKKHSSVVTSTDDLLDASNSTLYHPLPDQEQPSTSKKKSTKEKQKKHSQQSSPATPPSDPNAISPVTCDGTAQTEVSGTLSRRKDNRLRESTDTTPQDSPSHQPSNPDYSSPNRFTSAPPPQGNSFQQQNLLNAFHHLMQQQVQQNSNLPPLPPQLAHQLYLSWLGAYYAGATGAPPPAPPPFIIPQTNNSNSQHLDVPPVLSPANLQTHQLHQTHDRPPNAEEAARYYEQFAHPHNQDDGYNDYNDVPPPTDQYHFNDGVPAEDYARQERGRPTTKCDNGHCNTSIVLTDADMTDTSSVASSVAKGEIAVANNPKGGVMIYVRSQPNSRSNSTAGTHESVESLNTSDNVQSLGSSEHGSQTNLSERKKSPRGSSKGKKIPKQSSPAKNGLSSRKATEGERVDPPRTNLAFSTNDGIPPPNHNNNHSLAPSTEKVSSLHATDAFLGPIPSPNTFSNALSAPNRRPKEPVKNSTPSGRKSVKSSTRKPRNDPDTPSTSFNTSAMLQDANPDASHEEMILSLRRAPLATIEDDVDGFLSGSHASSCSSLNSAPPVPKETKNTEAPPKETTQPPIPTENIPKPQDIEPATNSVDVEVHENDEATGAEENSESESDAASTKSNVGSIDRSAGDISIYSLDASDGSDKEDEDDKQESDKERSGESSDSEEATWPAPPVPVNGDGVDKFKSPVSGDEQPSPPQEPATVTQTIDIVTSPTDNADNEEIEQHQSAGSVTSSSSEPFAAPQHPEVPLIDVSDSDASSTATEGEKAAENGDLGNGEGERSNSSSDLSTSDENHKMSDGSYDGDQSRTEESILADKEQPATNGTNQVVEVDGEMVVVQEPQFDYYKWKPDQDVWKSPEYKKFVEIFNFPASMSDIEVTQHLSKYRGLRLARVDATHALCTLPSDVIAEELADQHFTAFETRPLCDASKQTKAKAKAKLENEKFEEVRAQRPKSSNAVAKRMIAGALGSSHRSSANKQSTKK